MIHDLKSLANKCKQQKVSDQIFIEDYECDV